MADYTQTWSGALADVTAAGAALSFALSSPGTQAADGTFSGASVATVAGYATEAPPSSGRVYEALGLTQAEAKRWLFVASTYGDVPALGAAFSWGGIAYTIRSVEPYAPDGTAIFSYVVGAR